MKIKGIENLTDERINYEMQRGGRFVLFEYCISVIFMTFKRSSDVYFIKKDEGVFGKAFQFSLISLLLGWWGFPWGPIYTFTTLFTNIRGGRNVTNEILALLATQNSQG